MVGQPEIRGQRSTSQLLPLRQRIGIRYHLEPFSAEETEQYIYFRLNRSGGNNTRIFTKEAVATIHEASLGNPRLINILCDHAMLSGFAKDLRVIDKALILEALEELRLPGEATLQTSEVRGRPRPLPSKFIRQPSPEPAEFVSQPKPQPSEVVSEPSPQISEVTSQPSSEPAEVSIQPTAQTSEVVIEPSRQQAEVVTQSTPQQSEVLSQPTPQPSEVVSEPSPQIAEVASQPSSELSEVSIQPKAQPADVVSEPSMPYSELATQTRPQQSEVLNEPRKAGKTLVHFMIALALMSVIVVMGIIIPTEISNLISGAK